VTAPDPAHIANMPTNDHTVLVNQILAALEKNLGIKVVAWERVK
jgi:hypothetical protein